MFNNIPDELKSVPNFVLWRLEVQNGIETKVPYNPNNGYHASVSNPATWSTFKHCVSILPQTDMSGIGFVITPELNLTCIDVDDPFKTKPDGSPKFTNPEELQQRQINIAKAFDSYSEVSPSGRGIHIWVKGTVPTGRDKFSVGVYPHSRFMTMTGVVYNPAPIRDMNGQLYQLWAEMGEGEQSQSLSSTKEQLQSDTEIYEAAANAQNGEKFLALWEGDWERYYESQSEADYALIDILAFYTQNGEQIRRLFRASVLGKRKKAQRDKYIDDMVAKSFDKQPPEIDLSALKENLSKAFLEKIKPPEPIALPVSETAKVLENLAPEVYIPPRGLIGEIAAFVYKSARYPVPEIALAAAVGLLAGVCGRCYNISGTGLNQYVVLLARTGRGKDAMSEGISKLIASILPTVPQAALFNGPGKIQSEEALIKHITKTSKSFVSIFGEFGKTLKKMDDNSRNVAQQGVKDAMLRMYSKSGKNNTLSEIIYSDAAKNTDSVRGAALSILAETIPNQFYELLNETMISEGFLSRFLIIEYLGKRVEPNEYHYLEQVPERLKEQFGQLCAYSLQLNSSNNVIDINIDKESDEYLKDFRKFADDKINSAGDNSIHEELYNRAHLMAVKLAGLLAVGTNYINPCVSLEQAEWSVNIVKHNIEKLLSKFETGEAGIQQAQNSQLADLKKAFSAYLRKKWDDIKSYPGVSENAHKAKVVPHGFLTGYCRMRQSFKQDRIGPVQALKTILTSLIESGEIQELGSLDKMKLGIGRNGKCYVVLDVKSFL